MDSYIKINSDSTNFFTTPSFARLVYHPFSIVIVSKEESKKITISYLNIIGWKQKLDCLEIVFYDNHKKNIENIKILHPFIHKVKNKLLNKINIIKENYLRK